MVVVALDHLDRRQGVLGDIVGVPVVEQALRDVGVAKIVKAAGQSFRGGGAVEPAILEQPLECVVDGVHGQPDQRRVGSDRQAGEKIADGLPAGGVDDDRPFADQPLVGV